MSERTLRIAGLALAIAGIAIAGYLTWVHYAESLPVCVGGGGSCERVQTSDYAELAGVPVAVIGLAGYVAMLVVLSLPGTGSALLAAFGGLAGAAFSIYLTYVELFVIEAICQWCVANAVAITALAAVAIARYLQLEG
ncbi:MAG TPA: vitamin K epoxide reductase family protein [Solirubrobacterales bacterium]|nr:vitamin K epoxide reductase family protein [Solirubrobacterales bacterium]